MTQIFVGLKERSGYFCPVCKMEVANIGNHITCPGPNRNSGPFPGKDMGGGGVCSKCGAIVNDVAHHESDICGNLTLESREQRIKELEEENKKLRDSLKILNEKLDVVNRRVNRMQDDAYNDIMPDRDDYR